MYMYMHAFTVTYSLAPLGTFYIHCRGIEVDKYKNKIFVI